jgi:hypothetical protein
MQFLEMTDDTFVESIDTKTNSDHLNIVFSHNINGETHPCGCRNFPLGGMSQVAGKLYELKKKAPLIYLDTGDALFISSVVPDSLKQSQTFTANSIANSFNKMGLKFFTPGDQDFALGEEFLVKLSHNSAFDFLITNLAKESKIKAKKWKLIKYGDQNLIFLGITNPDVMGKHSNLFSNIDLSMNEVFAEIKKNKIDLSKSKIILLSHSGMDEDKRIAKKFKNIDWIIGAHTQSFLKEPVVIGNTKIVQVLSRNHYLGHIKIPASSKAKASYEIIETRDELRELWKENPFVGWLETYKSELDKILTTEQEELSKNFTQTKSAPTFNSCTDCHSEQVDFWQSTAHSLALVTLHNEKAMNNPACIKCHSLDHAKESGFTSKKNIIIADKDHSQYWSEFNTAFKNVKNVRSLSSKKRLALSKKWVKLDEKFEVSHNFGNVQCLNCHDKNFDHPFEVNPIKVKKGNYQEKCIACHTQDQSPTWYNKDSKGIAKDLNQEYFKQKLKEVSCPTAVK